jgi:apolipoprotein N-acyltransferase
MSQALPLLLIVLTIFAVPVLTAMQFNHILIKLRPEKPERLVLGVMVAGIGISEFGWLLTSSLPNGQILACIFIGLFATTLLGFSIFTAHLKNKYARAG